MSDLCECLKYKNLSEVKERIDKNYEFIKELEKMIEFQDNDLDKLTLISLIGYLYSSYVTGKYASEELEKEIITIGNSNIKFLPEREPKKNHILIVMTESANVGGHSVIVNNWMRWDTKNQYSVAFTEQDYNEVAEFIKESVNISRGKIYCLKGDYIEKAKQLLNISQDFEKVLLFTHMYDVVPVLAYGNRNWKIPILFYNHADFRFSFGISIADRVLNLSPYDKDKTERFRGVPKGKNIIVRFPNGGQIVGTTQEAEIVEGKSNKNEKKHLLAKRFGFCEDEKLIVSAGADFKYENILGYQFDQFVDTLLKKIDYKATFLIIGADKEREKWKKLRERTNGKGCAMGTLPRKDMDDLIEVADLYVLSFPMLGTGGMIAERAKVPCLALFITERGIETYRDNAARTVDELVEKSLDVLNGNGNKYLGHMQESYETQEEWCLKWEKILDDVKGHSITKICPKRLIETQEYVNCQLMQETAFRSVWSYMSRKSLEKQTREQIFLLDQKYEMGIFQNGMYAEYNDLVRLSDKHLQLYLTAIKWIQLKQEGKRMTEFLYRNGYHTVAIYGMSYMGETIYRELKESNISVLYGIDQQADRIQTQLKVYHPNEAREKVDLIINSTMMKNQIISAGITKMQNIPVISIEEILDAMAEE